MIEIGQTKHSATVIRLTFVFAHGRRPPMPQDWNYGTDRVGGASMALGSGWRGFERYGLFSSIILPVRFSPFVFWRITSELAVTGTHPGNGGLAHNLL
jgi:hypothetical protein